MAGAGAVGGAGGAGGQGGTSGGGAGGVGGSAGGGAGGVGGSAGTAGMEPDDDGGVIDEDASVDPGPVLPMDGNALSVCLSTDDCNGDDLVCAVFGSYRGYCAQDCSESADCAEIDGIEPTCDLNDRCVIDCAGAGEGDGACPENMACAAITTNPLNPIYRCQYPEEKNLDTYEVCDVDRGNADCREHLTCQMFPGLTDLRDSVCVAGCTEAADCEDHGGNATPVCDPMPLSPLDGMCALDCDEDDDCPEEMTCIEVDLLTNRCGHEI